MADSNGANALDPTIELAITYSDSDDEFLARGWFPHQIKVLRELYDPPTFTHSTEMNKNGFWDVIHRQCADSARCIAHNVDVSNYTTRHTNENSPCQFVVVDCEKIILVESVYLG